MVVHSTKSLNLVDRNPGTWAKTEGYTFFWKLHKEQGALRFSLRRLVRFEKFSISFHPF